MPLTSTDWDQLGVVQPEGCDRQHTLQAHRHCNDTMMHRAEEEELEARRYSKGFLRHDSRAVCFPCPIVAMQGPVDAVRFAPTPSLLPVKVKGLHPHLLRGHGADSRY